jgi:hypothetical protein
MTSLLYPALVSSIIETSITHPIDVMKIHRQTSQPIIYKFKTLYSGYIPRAIGNIPSRTIFLFSQDYLHNYFNKTNTNTYANSCCRKNYQISKNVQSIIIPLLAGFTQTLVDTPVENMKMNQVMKMKNTFLYKELYKGFVPHFYRNFIFVLCVYNFKQLGINNGSNNDNSRCNSYFGTAIYGALGGLFGSYVSHPLDTIKTCIQTNRIYEGMSFKDYMRGCHLRAGMGMINMFVSLYVFEIMKKF